MSPRYIKVRYLLMPLVALAVGFVAVYSALNWLLVARTGWLPFSDELVELWLPFGLAALFVILWVHPAIRLLKADKARRIAILYYIAALATVGVPTFLMQEFKPCMGCREPAHVNAFDARGALFDRVPGRCLVFAGVLSPYEFRD